MRSLKRIILNADDYGAAASINSAVETLIDHGPLRSVSVIANGAEWESATSFLRNHPEVSAGVHLNLIEGIPVSGIVGKSLLTGSDGCLRPRGKVLLNWARRPVAMSKLVRAEWSAQIERLLNAGLKLTHLDSHQHLHAFPPAFRLAASLAREYGIRGLRIPAERNRRLARFYSSLAVDLCTVVSRLTSDTGTFRLNDNFLGFKLAGAYCSSNLLADIRGLKPGITEVALHPSANNNDPYADMSGRDEMEALMAPEIATEMQRLGIESISWNEA